MANPVVSLNRSIPWLELLKLLDVPHRGLTLPATIQCPLCQTGVTTIVEDRLLGGQWFYC